MAATVEGVEVHGPQVEGSEEVLTPEALAFVAALHREFSGVRDELLSARREAQARRDSGELHAFLDDTRSVREDDGWRVAPAPDDLQNRRVEITGPTDRKMVINALNSGARGFMADFEDSNSPTWRNMVGGQVNLTDAIDGTIDFTSDDGKEYRLNDEVATLLVRPRGWHLPEKHLVVDGSRPAGAIPRSTSRRSPRCATTRSARPETASTAPGSRTPTSCPLRPRSSTRCWATAPTRSIAGATRCR